MSFFDSKILENKDLSDFQKLKEHFQTPSKLRSHHQFRTGITRLDSFLSPVNSEASLIEWGCPHGSLGRFIITSIIASTEGNCLWLFDQSQLCVYPNSWKDMGLDLDRINFINTNKPLKNLKPVFLESTYKSIVIDSCEFLSKADLQFLYQKSKEHKLSLFLIRHYFLSNRNGNPFFKYRLNASFSLKDDSFKLNFIKGQNRKEKSYLRLKTNEVFSG